MKPWEEKELHLIMLNEKKQLPQAESWENSGL